ncbi:MAG TPA: formimidoylglutamase [Pusillimonas sp.]|uniref:formimidoylglutamase n=1 Tax=Pusillimonas sp. TaxID=3040095 RepID=UPI002C0D268E|nr:formimidoylglutamase [Pusillimonas sp.]HUH88503.1 formimidoylglutamase [Pusillimonas sp.]
MYTAADMTQWKGRIDAAEGAAGLRWHQLIQPVAAGAHQGVALTGFACDAGVHRNHGRPGAHKGPDAIRAMLGNMPAHECRWLFDAGNISPQRVGEHDGLEAAQDALSQHLAGLLHQGLLPITLGGGHEIAFGSFEGLARYLQVSSTSAPRIGVINLDAHFDLRQADRASSGTPFRQIAESCQQRGWMFNYCCLGISRFANTQALFDRAESLGVMWMLDEELNHMARSDLIARLDAFTHNVDHIYFTICLDVLPAHIAPGVSAPAVLGVPLDIVETLVDRIASSGKLRLADIAELNPEFDIDHRSARVAARLVARIANQASSL